MLGQVVLSACLEAFYFMVPLQGSRNGVSASTIGIIISCAFVANCAIRSFMPLLLARYHERQLLVAMFFVAAASIFPFALFSSPPVLMLLSAGVGVCHGIAMPILTSLIYTASPPGRQGEVSGVRTMFTNGSITVTQLLAGGLGSLVGIAPVMWLVALLAFGGGWYSRRRAAAGAG
jgi:MFS family permease